MERERGAGFGGLRSTWTPVRRGGDPQGGRCRSGPRVKVIGAVPFHPRAASDAQARVPRPGVGRVGRGSGRSARTQRATLGGDPPRQLYLALHPPRSPRIDAERAPQPQGLGPGPGPAAGRGPSAPGRKERSSRASLPPTPPTQQPALIPLTAAHGAEGCGSGWVGGPGENPQVPAGDGAGPEAGRSRYWPGSHEPEVTRLKSAAAASRPA